MPRFPKNWLAFDPMVALLSIPVAIFLIIVEIDTPKANIPQAIGPEVMPIGVLILLIINAALLFLQSNSAKRKKEADGASEVSGTAPQPWFPKYKSVMLVLLGLVVYGLILVPAGFILATSFLIIFEARLLQPGKWVRNVVVGFGFGAAVYLAFVKLLHVMLPAGILG